MSDGDLTCSQSCRRLESPEVGVSRHPPLLSVSFPCACLRASLSLLFTVTPFGTMLPIFALSFASALSLGLLLQPAVSRTVERRYDNDEIKVDESKHDQQFFNFVTVWSPGSPLARRY